MSGHKIVFTGVLSLRESDQHPIVTDQQDGSVWLMSGNSDKLMESGAIKVGDTVRYVNRKSERGWPTDIQQGYDKRKDDYCSILCPYCDCHW